MNKQEARSIVESRVPDLVKTVNDILAGRNLDAIRPILRRIDSSGTEPYWFADLREKHRLPLDGKTVGSVIEKLTVCAMEHFILGDGIRLSVNPAKGIDVPELDLSIKSPSTNFCTSEPFRSPYERLLGNKSDALVLLTNYQSAKKDEKHFTLRIIDARYLHRSEIADQKLCAVARNVRAAFSTDSSSLEKLLRFIAHFTQGEWETSAFLELLEGDFSDDAIAKTVENLLAKGKRRNRSQRDPDRLIPERSFDRLAAVKNTAPLKTGLVRAIDEWVESTLSDRARHPSDEELEKLKTSPLDGKIGMSFALQWRYNFSSAFPEYRKGE